MANLKLPGQATLDKAWQAFFLLKYDGHLVHIIGLQDVNVR